MILYIDLKTKVKERNQATNTETDFQKQSSRASTAETMPSRFSPKQKHNLCKEMKG
jgi:hypothetical protein